MNKYVFVVTRGEYSDFTVCGIFTTNEEAEAWMASPIGQECATWDSFNPVEKWELNKAYDRGDFKPNPIILTKEEA